MDDLKLYASNEHQLQSMLELVSRFSEKIKMEFGLNKCAAAHYKKGKLKDTPNIKLMNEVNTLKEPAYKYLGMLQTGQIKDRTMRDITKEKYLKRVKTVVRIYLPGKEKIVAINSWAVPLITYTYGVLKWSDTELKEMDRATRIILTKNRMHHSIASTARLYLPRTNGGRGLSNLEDICRKQVSSLQKYFNNKETTLHRAIRTVYTGYSVLNLARNEITDRSPLSVGDILKELKGKALHGKYFTELDADCVDKSKSVKYLTEIPLTGEIEGFICAIEDQVIATRSHRKFVLKENITDRCRMCNQFSESIQHISSGCPTLAPTSYTERHNNIAKIIHLELSLILGLQSVQTKYFNYTPEPVMENSSHKLYWDTLILTDKTVLHNKPDILWINKYKKECFIIDIAVPLDQNLQKTATEKIQKYQDLAYGLRRVYQLNKAIVLPFVISANGLIHKDFTRNTELLKLNPKLTNECLKAAILGTVRIVRKVLKAAILGTVRIV
ncbi:uncharacterized protein LOC115890810 [Sitophilus oryzae]|uniref:Uncharacterized protein LOC115890810 n=1 Tax=Sitophilus oryzae TaxID=7048 RepID=A0A6J2YVX8_SITOR|nr:uncharacterized protein LOC115890810 [Sitophilus oryzae]